jgi:hypothetical protein
VTLGGRAMLPVRRSFHYCNCCCCYYLPSLLLLSLLSEIFRYMYPHCHWTVASHPHWTVSGFKSDEKNVQRTRTPPGCSGVGWSHTANRGGQRAAAGFLPDLAVLWGRLPARADLSAGHEVHLRGIPRATSTAGVSVRVS